MFHWSSPCSLADDAMVDATATKLSDQWQLCFSKKPDSFFCSEQKESMGWRRVWETEPSGDEWPSYESSLLNSPETPASAVPKKGDKALRLFMRDRHPSPCTK